MIKIPLNVFEKFIKTSFLEFLSSEEVGQLYEVLSQVEVESNQKVMREEPPQFLYFCYNGNLNLKHRMYGYDVGSVRNGQSIEFRTMILRSPQWQSDWHSDSALSLLRIPWQKVEPILTKYPTHVAYLTKLAQSTSLQRFKRDLLSLNFSFDFIFQLISRMNLVSSTNFQQLIAQGQLNGNFFFNVANGEFDISFGTDLMRRKIYNFRTGESSYFSQFSYTTDTQFIFGAETRLFVLTDKEIAGLKSHSQFEKFNSLFGKNRNKRFRDSDAIPYRKSKRVEKSDPEITFTHAQVKETLQPKNLVKELADVVQFPVESSASVADKSYYQKQAILSELLSFFAEDLKNYEFFSREIFFEHDSGIEDFYFDLTRIGFKCKTIPKIENYDIRSDRWYVATSISKLTLFKFNSKGTISVLNSETGSYTDVSESELFGLIKQDSVIEIAGFNKENAVKKKSLKYVSYFEFKKILPLVWDKKQFVFLSLGLTFWIYIFSLSFPIATQYLLDQVVQFGKVDKLPFLAFFLLFFAVTSTYFESSNQRITAYLTGLLSLRIKDVIHKNLFSETKYKRMNVPQSIIISRIGEVEMLSGIFIGQILPTVVNGLLVLFSLLVVYMYSPLISAFYFLAIPAACFLIFLKKRQIINLKSFYFKTKENELDAITDSYSRYETTLNHKQNIQARWKIEASFDLSNKYARINSFVQSAYQTLQLLKSEFLRIATFIFALSLYKSNHLTLGQVLALTMLAPRFGSLIQSIVSAYFQYFNFTAGLDKLNELLTEPHTEVVEQNTAIANMVAGTDKFQLKLEDVSYADKNKNLILNKISFELIQGQQGVLLGAYTLSKSVLLKILTGQEFNHSGRLLHGAAKPKIAFLESEFGLFTGSLVFNLTLDDKNPDLARLGSIISTLNLESELLSKPDGLNFPIHGNGFQLSPSEIKKIMLVRLLYLQPDILVCDAMSDYFDVITENELFSNVKKLMSHGILVWSTQNFSIATKASKVLNLEKGRLTSFGAHKELIDADATYADFFLKRITINS